MPAPPTTLTRRDLNRALLARQLLLSRDARSPEDGIEQVGGLQAQLARPPFIGLWSRLRGFDRAALLTALHTKAIAGAGLDVFDIEPLPTEHPLRKIDNVVLTPHLGYVSIQNYRAYFDGVVDDIRAFLDGKPVRILE